jgi:hypothetical protein
MSDMLMHEIVQYTDGDYAVKNRLINVYEWHLSHKSESKCVFTSSAIDDAIKYNDLRLIIKLLNFGVEFVYKSRNITLFNCKDNNIRDLLLLPNLINNQNVIRKQLYRIITKQTLFRYLFDNGFIGDDIIYSLLTHNYSPNIYMINALKYITSTGYKLSIRYCSNIINNHYIELIDQLWKNGNDDNCVILYDDNNPIYMVNKLWIDIRYNKSKLYKIVLKLDPTIPTLMIRSILSVDFTIHMEQDNYNSVMDFIISDTYILQNYCIIDYILYDIQPFMEKINKYNIIKIILLCINSIKQNEYLDNLLSENIE